jgi:ribosomal protein L18E
LPISKQAEAKIIKAGGQIQSADKAVKTDATNK